MANYHKRIYKKAVNEILNRRSNFHSEITKIHTTVSNKHVHELREAVKYQIRLQNNFIMGNQDMQKLQNQESNEPQKGKNSVDLRSCIIIGILGIAALFVIAEVLILAPFIIALLVLQHYLTYK
jgi:hypothetical protein